MFRLRIAGKVQSFQNKEEMVKAYDLAIKNNQSVETVQDDEVTVKTEEEAVQSEVVEEGFSQDFQQAAPSANAEPTSIAQEDADSLLETGSSVSRDKDLKQPNVVKPEAPLDITISQDELEANNKRLKEINERYSIDLDMGLINPDTGSKSPEAEERAVSFRDFAKKSIGGGMFDNLGVEGQTINAKLSNGLQPAFRKKIKEDYLKTLYNPDPNSSTANLGYLIDNGKNPGMPNEYAIDQITAELVDESRQKELTARNEKIQFEGRGIAKEPSEKVAEAINNRINKLPLNQQLLARTNNKIAELDRIIATGSEEEKAAAREARRAELIKSANQFEKMNGSETTNPYRDGFTYEGSSAKNNYKQLFNQLTGEEVSQVEASLSDVPTIQANAEMIATAEKLVDNQDRESLQASFYYNVQKRVDLSEKSKKQFDFKPEEGSYLAGFLKAKGYKSDENGLFTNVVAADVLPLARERVSDGFGIFGEKGNLTLNEAAVPREDDLVLPGTFLQNLVEDKMRNKTEGAALDRAYLLNIDPGSEKLNSGDYVATFAKEAAKGVLDMLPGEGGRIFTQELPQTSREMLDTSKEMLDNAGIELTKEQEDTFERGIGMKVTEQLGAFVPMLINFAVLNKAAGAAGMTRVIGNLMKGAPKQKALGLLYGALLEEIKFEAATFGEAKTLGGTGFFAGGQLANFLMKRFKLGGLFSKVVGGAVGGTAGSETAKVAESFADDLQKNKDFKTSMEEYYGNADEVTERLIIDGIVFGILGGQHAKPIDFMKRASKQKLGVKLNSELKEIEDRSRVLRRGTEQLDVNGNVKYKYTKEDAALYTKKKRQYDEIQQDLSRHTDAFNRMDIGEQTRTASQAKKRIAELNEKLRSDPFKGQLTSPKESFDNWTERGILENIITQADANKMSARKEITKQAKAYEKALGEKPGKFKVFITENGEGMNPENKGEFQIKGDKILVNLSKFQKGVLSQEGFHAFMDLAFDSNPAVAAALRKSIETDVENSLKDVKFSSKEKNVDGSNKSVSFKEIIKELYPDKTKTDEEYVANIVEFLGNPKYVDLLLKNNLVSKINRATVTASDAIGLPIKARNNLLTAKQTLEFLYRFGENKNANSVTKMFDGFKTLAIDGVKLIDIKNNNPVESTEAAGKIMESKEINPGEKKDIFSKATKGYEEMIAGGSTPEQAGVMVGYEMQPLIRKKLRSYIVKKGLEIPDAIVEDIVSDVALSSGKGTASVPSAVVSYTKGANLIKYIKENPEATPAEISKKAEEFGVRVDRVQSFVDLAKEGGEATMTSYVFGQLNNRILGVMQKPEYRDIFNTFSIDKNPGQIDNLAEGEGLGGGGISDGYVDLSSPEQNVRINRIKAEVALKLPEEVKESINGVGERLLMSTPLKNLEAKQEGKIELPSGKTAEIVISKSEQATIKIEGEPTETIRVRSPKILEEKFGTGKKSFIKSPTTKEKLYRDAIDLIYPKLEKAMGGLKDNYTATPEYEAFIDNAYPLLKDYLSQSAVNKRFAEFKEPVIDKKTGKVLKKKTSAGGTVFTKKAITLAEWRKYFIGDGSKRIDGRRRSIAEAFAGEFGFDSVMEALSKESMKEQIESRQEEIGVDLIENYVAVIAKEIDRGNPGVMASKVIEIVKNNGGTGLEVFYDSKGNMMSIDEILKTKAGRAAILYIERKAQDDLQKELFSAENQDRINSDLKAKLAERGIDFSEQFDNIKEATPKQLMEYDQAIKEILSYLPKITETFTATEATNLAGNLLASLLGYTGRRTSSGRLLGAPEFRKNFFDGKNIIGSKNLSKEVSALWTDAINFAEKNNFAGNGLSISVKSRKFLKSVKKIQYDYYPGTRAQKIKAINDLPGRKEAILDITVKEKMLDALLATIGEIGGKMKAGSPELKKFSIAVGKMLLNNDGAGIRRFSSDNYIEFNINEGLKVYGKDKKGDQTISEAGIKNEHLISKAQFGAEVIVALLDGKLTPQNIKKITSQYISVIGSKNGQKLADKLVGATIENSSRLKMLISKMFENNLKTIDVTTLKDFYNWTTGENAYSEMIRDYAETLVRQPLLAEKAAKQANIDLVKERGLENLIDPDVLSTSIFASKTVIIDKAFEKGRDPNKEPKGISVFDFDDTLARTKSNVLYTMPDGTKGKLNATEFAKKSEALEAKGAEFDFSEFSKVVQGKLGPLFSEAKKKEGKYTNKDVFVLTARPANSAKAIYEFLKSEGLEIPIDNIVGLGNGAAKAKAEWMVGKVAEGYNDFYFADDAIKNVEAVRDALGLFDVKSKVQQAIMASKKLSLEKSLAGMIERKKGIPADKKLSAAIASNMGRKKGRYDWFIPAAAEDFAGMMYKFYGKGKQGNEDMALIKETLIRPFNRAENAISTYKQRLGADYESLEKQLGKMDLVISKETKKALEDININADQAARVFIYDKLGYDIPGLKSGEISNLVKVVNGDARLKAFAEGVMGITKTKKVFPRPGETWFSSNTRYELYKYATEGVRAEFLKEWESNVEKMFTEDNYARIEAGYGKDYVKNLKEMLSRMKTGKTRSSDLGKDVQAGMDYVNGSVGVIMFLNTRSAVLQTISAVNYVNWSDNNPIAIGKAVAKPKEWGKTFLDIYNSDFLKQRRGGLEINVEEAEIAKAVERSKGKARALYDGLIKIGFKPTQMADSFAIAFGGTPFLMNRTATYVKQGLTPEAAKKRAFEDFREVSEESQQSSRQDRVSNIQTGIAGRLIFAFANTPMQMTRMTKKATLDLAYGRGDAKTNISKILYYGAVQSYIFYALQQSQFLRLFGGDDEDMSQEQKDFNEKNNDEKTTRIANSMFDSFISGSGSPGKVAITAKNTVLKYLKEKEKGYKADYGNVINEALSISPPLSSKTKKIYSAFKTYKYYSTKQGQKELAEFGQYAFDNPMLMANAKVFSSVSNVPADRLIQKVNNLYSAFTDETLTPIQSAALAAGWDKWSLGLYDPKFMSGEEVATNKAARKEQLKQEKIAKKKATLESYNMNMSPEEKREVLKVLTRKEQGDSLRALGMRDIEFRSIMKLKEIDRIEKIISMQNKKQFNQDMLKISNTTRQDSLK